MDHRADVGGGGHGRRAHGADVGGGGYGSRALSNSREQGWMTILAIHAVYLTSNGLLYMPIQIKYENLKSSPFESHMAMTSSVVALCVYFCAAALQILLVQTKTELDDTTPLNHVIICSGILSSLSSILVLLPNMVGWVVIVSFVFATIILLAYDVSNCISKRNNSNNNNATPASESVAPNAEPSESLEISIEDNNETRRNNHDSVEMHTTGTISQATNT